MVTLLILTLIISYHHTITEGGVSWVAVNWRAGALRRPPTSSGCG